MQTNRWTGHADLSRPNGQSRLIFFEQKFKKIINFLMFELLNILISILFYCFLTLI